MHCNYSVFYDKVTLTTVMAVNEKESIPTSPFHRPPNPSDPALSIENAFHPDLLVIYNCPTIVVVIEDFRLL
jgi:hypothetical protein